MVIKIGERKWQVPEPQICMNLYVAGIVLLPIYIKFMGVLGQILSVPTSITTYFYYGILWLLLLRGISEIKKQTTNAILIAMLFVVILFFQLLLFPESSVYILSGSIFNYVVFQPAGLLHSMLFVFLGLAVSNFEHLGKLLHKTARIGILGATLTYALMLFTGINIHYDDMSTAYSICLLLCILVAFKEAGDWKYILMGTVCLIMAGTRGPIVCFLVAIIFRFIIFEKNFRRKILGCFLCLTAGGVVLSGIGTRVLEILNGLLSTFGIPDLRILDYINNGMILSGSSREDFISVLLEAMRKHPFMGYGVGGDRLILSEYYAHNFVLEILIGFGIVFGGIILLCLAYLFLRVLHSNELHIKKIGIGLFSAIVVKLLFSTTYIQSRELFLFLGLCITACKISRQLTEKEG